MTRHPDWMRRLDAVIQAASERPFSWGSHDCCTFAADCVAAITGVDPMAQARTYTSERGALRLIAKAGGLAELVAQFVGQEVAPALAQIGDIGLSSQGAVVVCNGRLWIGPSERGSTVLRLEDIDKAWRCEGAACLK